jgi:hypothetical protein
LTAAEAGSRRKETADLWETAPTNSIADWDVPEDDPRHLDWQTSDCKLFTTAHAISCGWLSVAGGVEVSVEVRSNAGDIAEECSACRCFCIRTDLPSQPDQPFILQHRQYFRWKLHIPWFPSRS